MSVPLASVFVIGFVRLGVTPDTVTLLSASTLIGSAALVAATKGSVWSIVAFLVLAQVGYALDGADGILARVTGTATRFGAWLDLTLDRIVHVTIFCLLMLAFLPLEGDRSATSAYMAPFLVLLVLSLGYHNATNLRSLMFKRPEDAEGGSTRLRALSLAKSVITTSCDFGLLLFALGVGMLLDALAIVLVVASVFHALALVALAVRVRQLSAAGEAVEL